jgi:hypothetical protein
MAKQIHIIGGGTVFHVRPHVALSAPAYGKTARVLESFFRSTLAQHSENHDPLSKYEVKLHLTKMADPQGSKMETNADVEALIDELIEDRDTRVIILNAALCDFQGQIVEGDWQGETFFEQRITASGKDQPRLKTAEGEQTMVLTPAAKLIGKIRKERKDIFVVGFKTTAGATPDEQYATALNMLKANSLNLVLANDIHTRHNMVVAPEETRYHEGHRTGALLGLVQMVKHRMQNTFTRSTVRQGESVPWDDPAIPDNLRTVVNHLIERGAYKPFRGVTAGHFAVRVDDTTILTSKRKVNFNDLDKIGLVRVEYEGDDKVLAFGHKPSVGGQSQRIVFREHPGLDCIVHAHVPLLESGPESINIAPQWQNECGSHQCGANTSHNLRDVPGFEGKLKVVMLDGHGPNVVFSRDVPAQDVIDFIEANFALEEKTGGLLRAVA